MDPLIQPKNQYLKHLNDRGYYNRKKKEELKIEYNNEQQAIAEFERWSRNQLKGMNWNNVLVVGGSILGSIRYSNTKGIDLRKTLREYSDIDIYVYGLSPEDAQKKV